MPRPLGYAGFTPGRKPALGEAQAERAQTALARELGISRETVYGYLRIRGPSRAHDYGQLDHRAGEFTPPLNVDPLLRNPRDHASGDPPEHQTHRIAPRRRRRGNRRRRDQGKIGPAAWPDRSTARRDIENWINFYTRATPRPSLGYQTPAETRHASEPIATALQTTAEQTVPTSPTGHHFGSRTA